MAIPLYFELIPAFQQFLDSSGNPLSGGTIETYIAGTSTPKVTYRESDGATSNGSTMTIQSDGFLQYGAWGTTGAFKIIEKDSLGATIRTRDNVRGINDIVRNGWVLIESQTASNSPTISFTSGFTSYNHYMLIAADAVPATDATALRMLTSSDGVNFDVGASDYSYATGLHNTGPANVALGDNAQDYIEFTSALLGNSTGEAMSMTLEWSMPSSATWKKFAFRGSLNANTSGDFAAFFGGASRKSASVLRGIRFLMSSGNISSGRFDLYGLAE